MMMFRFVKRYCVTLMHFVKLLNRLRFVCDFVVLLIESRMR